MEQGQPIEKNFLESDVAKIAETAKEHAASPEGKELKGEELIRKAIQTATQDSGAPAASQKSVAEEPLTKYAKSAPKEVQEKIEHYLQIAASDGILKATNEARRAIPFVLDAFHDALAAKLYPYLKEKGLIK